MARKRRTKSDLIAESALVMPGQQAWTDSCLKFRDGLDELYRRSDTPWRNDSGLCKNKDMSRALFSRVMGGERPPPSILSVLKDLLPAVYNECAARWIEGVGIDDARTLVKRMWGQLEDKKLPGKVYVLTSRPLERDSNELLKAAAEFLMRSPHNELVFIFGNLQHEWEPQGGSIKVAESDLANRWPLINRANLSDYVDEVLSHVEDSKRRSAGNQLRCLRVSFLDVAGADSTTMKRLARISAFQILSPLLIWMLFVGADDDVLGFVYFRCGENLGWYPLRREDSESLFAFVNAIEQLAAEASQSPRTQHPGIIELLSAEDLSNRLKRLAAKSAINGER